MIVLVRHGETTGESSIRLNGVTDVPLDAVGEAQMRAAGEALRERAFAEVLASPLRRSLDGARLVRPGAAVRVVEAFREVDFGRWETLTWAEAAARDPDVVRDRDREDFVYPGGEARRAFRERVALAARRELRAGVLAVLHKGVIKAAVAALTGMPLAEAMALPCSLGGITTLEPRGDWFVLVGVDDTGHL